MDGVQCSLTLEKLCRITNQWKGKDKQIKSTKKRGTIKGEHRRKKKT